MHVPVQIKNKPTKLPGKYSAGNNVHDIHEEKDKIRGIVKPKDRYHNFSGTNNNSEKSNIGKGRLLSYNFSDMLVHPGHFIQAKLSVNTPGDVYEREADAVADKIMQMPDTAVLKTNQVQLGITNRACNMCNIGEEKETEEDNKQEKDEQANNYIQRRCMAWGNDDDEIKRENSGKRQPRVAPSSVIQVLQNSGKPLDKSTLSFMENRFGFDFAKVKIHDNAQAHQSAKDINALAYTHQNNIVFGEGQYRPHTTEGKKLLAHELTHVIQQGKNINTKVIQRADPPAAPDLIIEYPGETVEENLFYLDSTAPAEVTRFGMLTPGQLKVYSFDAKGAKSLLKTYTIKKTVNPPPFLFILEASGFYAYGYNYNEEKHVFVGKKTAGISDEAKKILEQWDAALTINNWFEKTEDLTDFVTNHLNGQFFGLWVPDSGSGQSAGGEGETIPPQPEWMPAWSKAMNKLIKEVRAADAVSTDIPETFGFYYSKSKLKWRAYAELTYEQKKMQVYLDINEKDGKPEKLSLIRDKIRLKQLSPEPEKPSKDSKELAEELTWAYVLKKELDRKIAEERIAHKDSAELPDSTAIVTSEDQPGKAFLRISVYVTQSIPQNTPIPEVKATSELKKGTLAQPLVEKTSVDSLFEIVKKATLALRGREFKQTSSDPEKAEKTLEAFPAHIGIPAGREDFKTITGASLDATMLLNMSSVIGNNLLDQTLVAYKGIYYTWDIYNVNDIISAEEKKTLDIDWVKRRGQMLAMIKDSGRLKNANPAFNEAKLKQLNDFYRAMERESDVIDPSKPLSPERLRSMRNDGYTYGNSTRLTPEVTLSLPDTAGEYVIYCSAVCEPNGKIFRLPSEAFYPIKVIEGYTLAEESRDVNLTEIADLKKEIANTEDQEKKDELAKTISDIETRETTRLDLRTAKDITEVTRTKRLANKLIKIYKDNAGKKVSISDIISHEPETDQEDLYKIWFKIETTNPRTPQVEKLQKMVEVLESQLKGLKAIQQSIFDFEGDMASYKGGSYTPVTSLVSKVTGEHYNLITMLAVRDDTDGGTSVILVDVTAKQTQGKYYGHSDKGKDAGGLEEAIQGAYNKFGEECKYGDGYIAYRVPGTVVKGHALSKPGFKQRVLEALGYIAMAAGIAALVVGTIATGGALGVAAFALGMGAGIIGAGLAIYNIHDRYVNHRLEMDVELAMDILNIAGPFLQAFSAASKFAKLGFAAKMGEAIKEGTLIAESAEAIGATAKLHKLVQINKIFAVLQKGEALTNLSLLGYKTFKDLAAISQAYPNDSKKRSAMQWEVLKNAALAGTLALVSLHNEFKPTSTSMADLEGLVNSGYKDRNYIELMMKSGLFDGEGKWKDPNVKIIDDQLEGGSTQGDGAKQEGGSTQGDGVTVKSESENVKPPEGEVVKPGDGQNVKPADGENVKPADGDNTPAIVKDKGTADGNAKPADGESVKQAGNDNTSAVPKDKGPTADENAKPVDATITPENVPAQPAAPKPATKKPAKSKKQTKFPELEVDKPAVLADGSVATLKADGSIVIVSKIGKGKGRQGFEKNLLSGIKVGLKGWHRAHSQGQGTGSESPHGILYAPPEVNLGYQNMGIEARIREIFRATPPHFELTLTTVTKAHPDAQGMPSQRLASIDYRIEISEPGVSGKRLVLEAGIKVQDSINKPKVETSVTTSLAGELWSIHYADGTLLNISPKKFAKLKEAGTALEKELNELIGRLEQKLKTSKGDQKKIDQFHYDRFKELLDSLYEHPDLVPSIKAEIDEAQTLWYPKEPLISKDAGTYLAKWKQSINRGSKEHINRLLELSGSWKELMKVLSQDPKANKTTIKVLEKYREKVVTKLKKDLNATALPDATARPESDIDLNITGVDAGAKLIAAEKHMQDEFGPGWSTLLRLNFYTEGERLLRYKSVAGKMGEEATLTFEKELTKRSIQYNLAKMMQHSKGKSESDERITKLFEMLSPTDRDAVKKMADMDDASMLKKRNELHLEVDALQKELSAMDANDPARIEKSKLVTLKQMEINFYSVEAYIGPGALMDAGSVSGSPLLKLQKVMSNFEMIEHIIHLTNGNIIKAAREYELYKYMYRISDAIGAKQTDLFFDYLTQQIYKVNRSGAESMTAGQLQNLYNDFMIMADKYVTGEMKTLL